MLIQSGDFMGPLITAWAHSILGPRHPVAWYVVCIAGCPSYMWMCVVKVAVELFHKWITRELAINYVSQCIISIAQSVVLLIINPSHPWTVTNPPLLFGSHVPCGKDEGRKDGWDLRELKRPKRELFNFGTELRFWMNHTLKCKGTMLWVFWPVISEWQTHYTTWIISI